MYSTAKAAVALLILVALSACSLSPDPVPLQTVRDSADADIQSVYSNQEALNGRLGLYEAMARALKYNLDNRVALMQEALAQGQAELVRYDMLPTLAVSAGYLRRNNFNASSSISVITGQESLEPSFSQERERTVADFRFSWNLLDFGVSYLQAKQEADRYLIAKRQRQEIMLNLLQQTRAAFWRAAAAQAVQDDVAAALSTARDALDDVDAVIEERLQPPLDTLQIKRELLGVINELETLLQDLSIVQLQLAGLINQPPTRDIELAYPQSLPNLPKLDQDLDALELMALANSGDYGEQLYNIRIAQRQSRISLLRLLPGLELGYAGNFDSNDLLFNNVWRQASVQVTANLMQLLTYPQRKEVNEAQLLLADAQRQATAVAILTQTNIAWRRYQDATVRLDRAQQLEEVEAAIADLTSRVESTDAASVVERVQSDAESLRANLEKLQAYADAQEAMGAVHATLGLNPVPADYNALPVKDLADELRRRMKTWEAGDLPTAAFETAEEAGDNALSG